MDASVSLPAIDFLTWFLAILALFVLCVFTSVRYWRRRSSNKAQLVRQNALISALLDVEESSVLVNLQGIIEFINPSAEKLFRYRMRNARGKLHSDLFHLLDPLKRNPVNWLDNRFMVSQPVFNDCLLNCAGIQDLETHYLVRPVSFGESGDVTHFLLRLKDQAEIRALQTHLRYLQANDQQTKLLNRKSFELKLKVALNEAHQRGVRHSFCHISLDQFKVVNDALGQNAGDAFIERISDLLKSVINKNRDVLARISGDEFGILFRETKSTEALQSAERIRRSLSKLPLKWGGASHSVTASIGFVPINKQSGTPNWVLSIADAACKVAKEKGGNRLHPYSPNDVEIQKHRGQLVWIGRLKTAFEMGQFRLYAQPIHSLEPKAFLKPFNHYEVLIRLFDSDGMPISPDEFIPAAECYSMMPRLDRWVVTELLSQLKQIDVQRYRLIFSINLSGQSLDDPKFLPFVLEAIRREGISPKMLCFEITERLAINNLELARKFIDTLKSLGCRFSLDDFGTGVSSFSYLKELPVDYLKIDGSFIRDITTDDIGRAMVQSVNQVGQLMSVKTIAEFVENDQIIKVLRDIGIDYGQGYGISKPLPLPDIIATHQ